MIKIKLRRQLALAEMTQKELNEITGIRPATISQYVCNNTKMISVQNLDLLCKALKCTPGDLVEYEDDEKEK